MGSADTPMVAGIWQPDEVLDTWEEDLYKVVEEELNGNRITIARHRR